MLSLGMTLPPLKMDIFVLVLLNVLALPAALALLNALALLDASVLLPGK
jgi:hypothetical protein